MTTSKNKKYTNEIIEFIDSLAISTIDILKAIVDELNIHDTPIETIQELLKCGDCQVFLESQSQGHL